MASTLLSSPAQNPTGPEVTFRTQGILPPGSLYLSADDVLALQFIQPFFITGGNLTLTLRILTPDGLVVIGVYNINMATSPVNPFIVSPTEGFLLSATLLSDIVARGNTFCRLAIIRGSGGLAGGQGAVILQGYPTANGWLSYPNGVITGPQDGQGFLFTAGTVPPVAGADWTITVFAGGVWKFIQASGNFQASATVITRLPVLDITIPTFTTIPQFASNTAAAGSAQSFIWAVDKANSTVANVVITTALPDLILTPGTVIKSQTLNIQPGDQWSNVQLVFEHFIAG